MKRFLLIVIFFTSYLNSTILSQNSEWIVYDTTNSGLPGNRITCIEKDEYGNMWIGVNSDSCYLTKFNGTNWEVNYNIGPKIKPPPIYEFSITSIITSDDEGNMWLGTTDGLFEFDGISFTRWDTTNSDLPNNDIQDIAVDSVGNKWIATRPGGTNKSYGLAKIDSDWKVTTFDTLNSGIPSNDVWCIEIDKYDNIWVGTSQYFFSPWKGKGLAKFDGATWTVYITSNTGLPSNNIIDIKIDDANNKWIVTESGLAKYDNSSWSVYITDFYDYWAVDCLAIDKSGNKFIGTCGQTNGNSGMLKFDETDWTQYDENNSGLPSHHIGKIAVDKFNNKWIGANSILGSKSGLVIYNETGVITDIENNIDGETFPKDYVLSQNYPNPFNPNTIIKYTLPNVASHFNSSVILKVYDLLGRKVALLVNQKQKPGFYEIEWNATNNASGVYFYKLQTGDFVETKKMILLR